MTVAERQERTAARIVRSMLSAPILLKILGVGFVVAVAFGGTTFLLFNHVAKRIHLQVIEGRARSEATGLAESLERPLITGDLVTINRKLKRATGMRQDIRYIIVRDARGKVVAHTFDHAVPDDLLNLPSAPGTAPGSVRLLGSEGGRVFDVQTLILKGKAGTVQLGLSDRVLVLQNRMLKRLILGVLALSGALGAGTAAALAYLITHPLDELRNAASRIRQGDYSARVPVLSDDEIGSLAGTFNHMAKSLEERGRQIEQKERARLSLLRKLVEVQEDERKRLARELHDQVGQSLSRVLLTFQCARRDCECSDQQCLDLEGLLGKLIDEIRRMAWHVRPAVLDDYGLGSALERYLKETSKRAGIPIRFECSLPDNSQRLPRAVEVALYRIAQEALTNVVRHAQATAANVVLLAKKGVVTLVVGDNGVGFEPPEVMGLDGVSLGLLGMRERAFLFGGELEIESVHGSGTEVLVNIPLENENDAHPPLDC
ncbi:MAG: HAMP domain-containing protein [Nitrospiraceae bacterium]|nr:HAMP domain-containing protein [Nitrospiraceae bacterium]